MKDKFTLFTNLQTVSLNNIRTFCHALLLTDGVHPLGEKIGKRRIQLRGFGPDPAWPVFDLDVPSPEYTLTPAASHNFVFISDRQREPKPISQGAIMKMKDGPELQLATANNDEQILIEECSDIHLIWKAMQKIVLRFWPWPNMPVLQWVSLRDAR